VARRFQFRLETVLRLRRRAFEDKQRVVAVRLGEIAWRDNDIAALEADIRAELDRSRAVQRSARLDVSAVRAGRTHVQSLRRRIAQLRFEVVEHQPLLEGERAEMVKASVALKAIEKLKERRLARHQEDAERRENTELNEISINTFRRSGARAPAAGLSDEASPVLKR
jgi:flagellar export protein FliJ